MAIEALGGLFKGKQKDWVKTVKPKDLEAQIRLSEMQERKLESEIKTREVEVSRLFKEGIGKDEHAKARLATKIQRERERISSLSSDINKLNTGIRVLYKIQGLHERGKQLFKGPVWDKLLRDVPVDRIEEWMIKQGLNEDETMDKIQEYLGIGEYEKRKEETQIPEDLQEAWSATETANITEKEATNQLLNKTKEKPKETESA